jgi:hypothetical protein
MAEDVVQIGCKDYLKGLVESDIIGDIMLLRGN